jgi:hypothetical protein
MSRLDSGDNSDNVEYWTDDGYSTNNLNNPYQCNHLHKSQNNVEESKSAEDLDNNTVTDAIMVKEEQNFPKLPGGKAPTKIDVAAVVFVIAGTTQQAPRTVNLRAS